MSNQKVYPYTGYIPGPNNDKVLVWIQSPGRGYLLNVNHNVEINLNESDVVVCAIKCSHRILPLKTAPEIVETNTSEDTNEDA